MNYRIESKPEMILTGYGRRFEGAPGGRMAQEADFTMRTRPQQYLLMGLDSFENMPRSASEKARDGMASEYALGPEYAALFKHIAIPAHTYAVFETERCAFPTETFLDLRAQVVSEWLPSSGFRLADAPEITIYNWFGGADREKRYIELWMPVEERPDYEE